MRVSLTRFTLTANRGCAPAAMPGQCSWIITAKDARATPLGRHTCSGRAAQPRRGGIIQPSATALGWPAKMRFPPAPAGAASPNLISANAPWMPPLPGLNEDHFAPGCPMVYTMGYRMPPFQGSAQRTQTHVAQTHGVSQTETCALPPFGVRRLAAAFPGQGLPCPAQSGSKLPHSKSALYPGTASAVPHASNVAKCLTLRFVNPIFPPYDNANPLNRLNL
jgi:hypothetical protein